MRKIHFREGDELERMRDPVTWPLWVLRTGTIEQEALEVVKLRYKWRSDNLRHAQQHRDRIHASPAASGEAKAWADSVVAMLQERLDRLDRGPPAVDETEAKRRLDRKREMTRERVRRLRARKRRLSEYWDKFSDRKQTR